MIKAEVIADSKNEFGNRLTTMIVTFPRIILAEAKTHRILSQDDEIVEVLKASVGFNDSPELSKNSASSRAIPFDKMIDSVKKNPFIPLAWQKNHSGMQGIEYCTPRENEVLNSAHLVMRDRILEQIDYMVKYANPTKQLINRYLEPFMYHTAIVSATEWENFFALRCPQYDLYGKTEGATNYKFRSRKDAMKSCFDDRITKQTEMEWRECNTGAAEIHMMALAEAMWDAMNESTPKELVAGEWHIPFGDSILIPGTGGMEHNTMEAVKIATAKCAGVSYTIVGEDGKVVSNEKLIARHDNLAKMGHWSPFEHCAKAMSEDEMDSYTLNFPVMNPNNPKEIIGGNSIDGVSGNFRGFLQYRKMFDNENITVNGK